MKTKSGKPDSSSDIILLCNKHLTSLPKDIPDSPIYLDFSSNKIENLDFPHDFDTLISLHLNENPLRNLNSINFGNLRSLSLDFCNLNSLKKLPQLPNLISLSLVGNLLKSYEYFRIFPNLTKIDLRGNSVSFSVIHTIAAISSLRLSSVNGHSVTEAEFSSAYQMSPIVGHALRKGRDISPQSDEKAASLAFLTSEPPLEVKNIGGCLVIRCPVEGTSNVKWYQSSSNESEWEILDCTARTLPVTPMMFLRLIKCEYNNQTFYTSDVIQRDDSRSSLSFAVQPVIIGSGNVGAILSLNNQQSFPTKVKWSFAGNGESIGDCQVLIVPPEARGQRIIAEIYPFSPVFEKVQFAPLTTEIQISNVQETELIRLSIPDKIVEDAPFEIEYETYPANAKLKFTIDAADSFESPFTTVAKLQNKTTFTPTSKEVGKFLRVTTFVGDRQYCAYSSHCVAKVKATLKRGLICGENKTNHPRIFLFEFGDTEAVECTQKWYVDDGANKEYISEEKIVVPGDDCADLILGVEVTAKFDDGKLQTFVITYDQPLEKATPLINVPGLKQPVEDSKIVMVHVGEWLISDIRTRGGFRTMGDSEIYTPKASDIGKFIRFCSEMTDVIMGPVLPSQSPIQAITLVNNGELAVGSIIRADYKFYRNRECDNFHIKWIRCSRATPDKLAQDGGNEYILAYDDYGSKIKARIESTDWQKDSDLTPIIKRGDYNGPIIRGKAAVGEVLSVQITTGDVKWYHNDDPEICLCEGTTFSVRFIDVNHRIRVEVNGKYHELTESVSSVCVEEGQIIQFDEVFHRDLTEKTGVLWFRYVFSEQEWREVSDKRSYKVSRGDIGSVIRVVSYKIHKDGAKTSEIFADIGSITANSNSNSNYNSSSHYLSNEESKKIRNKTNNRINYHEKRFEDDNESENENDLVNENESENGNEEEEEEEYHEARLEFTHHGQLKIVGNFHEDDEELKFFWRRWRNGRFDEIKGSSERKMTPHPSMVGCEIDGGYQTSTSPDVIWTNKIFIEHALPPPEVQLYENGALVPGCELECQTNPVEGLTNVRYAWKRWDGMEFERIVTSNENTYIVTEEDTDCYVCCDVYFVDNKGIHGPKTSVETSGPVSSEAVVIEGDPIVGCPLRAEGVDEFMKICKFIWQRGNDENWIDVGRKRAYRCSCDDVGNFIRVICTSEDEERISHEVGPIEMNENILMKMKEMMKNGSVKFKGKEQNGTRWTIDALQNVFSIKSRAGTKSVNWKNVEIRAAPSSERKVEIMIGNSFRVSIVPLFNNDGESDAGFDRELCIIILRTFKEKAPPPPTTPRKKQ
ncbi:hypothetical protein TRFO_30545 [Tritrichomonas foetus]|uniref:Ig-like domain-containing protein n=1 Tax=Tritrichomonas foetus TaxID=1144522 RepID=A0A1J4JXZ4_9EUKA|nr:hypothetical protein TRFO_30545 [Tritrichomonas foetus]|eukprot:OHT02404.1 hypothetical protein TRFO_30545 [Tritrichomonas foetus]